MLPAVTLHPLGGQSAAVAAAEAAALLLVIDVTVHNRTFGHPGKYGIIVCPGLLIRLALSCLLLAYGYVKLRIVLSCRLLPGEDTVKLFGKDCDRCPVADDMVEIRHQIQMFPGQKCGNPIQRPLCQVKGLRKVLKERLILFFRPGKLLDHNLPVLIRIHEGISVLIRPDTALHGRMGVYHLPYASAKTLYTERNLP